MWDTTTCDEMQTGWKVCTNAADINHNTVMTNCPVTCASYRNEPCPVPTLPAAFSLALLAGGTAPAT